MKGEIKSDCHLKNEFVSYNVTKVKPVMDLILQNSCESEVQNKKNI